MKLYVTAQNMTYAEFLNFKYGTTVKHIAKLTDGKCYFILATTKGVQAVARVLNKTSVPAVEIKGDNLNSLFTNDGLDEFIEKNRVKLDELAGR